jgi:hypothetical protein
MDEDLLVVARFVRNSPCRFFLYVVTPLGILVYQTMLLDFSVRCRYRAGPPTRPSCNGFFTFGNFWVRGMGGWSKIFG